MIIQAEISLHPLKTDEISVAKESFVGDISECGLVVEAGTMSTGSGKLE